MNRIRRLGVGLGFGLVLGLSTSGAGNPAPSALRSHAGIRANFALLDPSGNLAIGLTEWRAATDALFESTDTNRDEYVEAGELGANVLSRETFPSVDGRRDGEELQFLAPNHLQAMDPRRAGRVTLTAMINDYRILLWADQVNRNIGPRGTPLSR